jgi:amino acid adenylation domain-containing protein/thioester reductase-like protein
VNVLEQHFLDCFDAIVAKQPVRPAVVESGDVITSYQTLRDRARKLAAKLVDLGVRKEDPVAICVEKSADYLVAMLATWYAGAAFVPVDPTMPIERLQLIAKECALKFAIVGSALRGKFEGLSAVLVDPADSGTANLDLIERTVSDLAYIIFTSGSTGLPKGVLVSHAGIVNFLTAQIEAFQFSAQSRSLFVLSTSFDASVSDIGCALMSGASLYIEPACALQPGPKFMQLIADRQISHIDLPPSMLKLLKAAESPKCLKTIIIGGEVCPAQVIREWAPRVNLVNVYGPTEATVCTSLGRCDADWDLPLIGRPLPNVEYLILSDDMQPCKKGTAGELYIAGPGLARGYLNREDLNQKKFVFHNGKRLYRTGDQVVQLVNGDIQFIGRCDRQFKLRGMLIEPEEIEARLLEHPEISRCAVLKRKVNDSTERDVLVAFVTTREKSIAANELRDHLNRSLPKWMIPQHFEFISPMPETVTGKVNMDALRQLPLAPISAQESDRELDELQLQLVEVWKRVLGLTVVSISDNFFEIGGDSFAVLEAVVCADSKGIVLPPELLLKFPTIESLAPELSRLDQSSLTDASVALSADFLRQDVALDADWKQLLSQAKLRAGTAVSSPQNVLLTGAAGFLGSRLLTELLARTDALVYCLVRAADEYAAKERVETAVANHGLVLTDQQTARIIPLVGDLSKSNFGMTDDAWRKLSESVDTVFHCAAHVNMLLPYSALRASNVQSTQEMVRFLCAGRRKFLHYASTLSVFVATDQNQGVLFESDHLERTQLVYGGYAQTKWASEVFLRSVESACGPVSHYRFGLITGDTRSGYSSETDFLNLFVKGLASLGCIPAERTGAYVDITPIDFAAAAMAEIALSDMDNGRAQTYHIANPVSLALDDLIEYMIGSGVRLDQLSADDFMNRVAGRSANAAESAAVLALCRCVSKDEQFNRLRTMDLFQATGVRFDMANTDAVLRHTTIRCPKPERGLIDTYLRRALPAKV